ncbi:hypothetical protein SAMN05443247_08078 [Bradyrhizobium erythrophlei]|jgi:hypothetical protein|nr:hypothetical protein SAMN05443247_08078 [Bradyrhizobium erythrophlei]
MIRKSGDLFSLATNAKRLRGDHAQAKRDLNLFAKTGIDLPLGMIT